MAGGTGGVRAWLTPLSADPRLQEPEEGPYLPL